MRLSVPAWSGKHRRQRINISSTGALARLTIRINFTARDENRLAANIEMILTSEKLIARTSECRGEFLKPYRAFNLS